jgi:poly [ADP-ribose] polymerase 10/14/15
MPPKKKSKTEVPAPDPKLACWQFLNDDNAWTAFAAEDSALIEKHFATRVAAFVTTELSFNKGFDTKYVFNFTEMKQTNVETKRSRLVCRIPPLGEVTWQWVDDMGLYVSFYDDDCLTIEKLFAAQGLKKPATTKELSFNKGFDSPYCFVFDTRDATSGVVDGTQTNLDSKKVRNVRRSQKKAAWDVASYGLSAAAAVVPAAAAAAAPASTKGSLDAPSHWSEAIKFVDAKLGQHVLVPVPLASDEAKTAAATLQASFAGKKVITVTCVQRVENAVMWGFYALHRDNMAARNVGPAAAETTVFFGDRNRANMQTIFRLGFDCRVAASSGKFGQGLYFGADAAYCDAGSCLQNADGSKEIVLCRAACGLTAVGSNGIRRPPLKKPPAPDLYDSCVDVVAKPTVHVFFNNAQAYPEYLVTYK